MHFKNPYVMILEERKGKGWGGGGGVEVVPQRDQ
jgi:hypothetical protein